MQFVNFIRIAYNNHPRLIMSAVMPPTYVVVRNIHPPYLNEDDTLLLFSGGIIANAIIPPRFMKKINIWYLMISATLEIYSAIVRYRYVKDIERTQ